MTYKVKLSLFPDWPIERQMPGRGPRWGEFEFAINTPVEEADFWVVSIGMFDTERCICPPERTLFVTYEPSSVHRYHPDFLAQFARVLTCQRRIDHPGAILGPQGQQWFAGLRYPELSIAEDYDSFTTMPPPEKTRQISLVSSRKVMTPEHEARLNTVERLQAAFGEVLDVYGNGFERVADKLEAILPYRYHIVLENSRELDYWSEKLADAYLGWAYPIYWGCPNLSDSLPAEAFQTLPDDDFDAMARTIQSVLDADPWQAQRPAIAEARHRVLNEQNFFGRVATVLRGMARTPVAPARPLLIRDERHFVPRSAARQAARVGRSLIRRGLGNNIPRRGPWA